MLNAGVRLTNPQNGQRLLSAGKPARVEANQIDPLLLVAEVDLISLPRVRWEAVAVF